MKNQSTVNTANGNSSPHPIFRGPVVHLSTARSWRGGEQQLLNLVQGLSARGVANEIVAAPGSPLIDRARKAGHRVTEQRSHFEYDPIAALGAAQRLRATGARIVHAHDAHATALAAIAASLSGTPFRVCTRRVDFKPQAWKYNWTMDCVICISQAILDVCRQSGVQTQRLKLVHSGVDLERIHSDRSQRTTVRTPFVGTEVDRPLILNVASLADHKGQKFLLDAMAIVSVSIPTARLLIVGEGKLERPLRQQAERLGLGETCQFVGFRTDVPALMRACDLFVMSSHMEGLCTSVIEAMAAGLAIVATRAGGLPELIEDGTSGRLVPTRDPPALAKAIIELLQDPQCRQKMGQSGQVRSSCFGLEPMVEGTLRVYETLTGSRGGR